MEKGEQKTTCGERRVATGGKKNGDRGKLRTAQAYPVRSLPSGANVSEKQMRIDNCMVESVSKTKKTEEKKTEKN